MKKFLSAVLSFFKDHSFFSHQNKLSIAIHILPSYNQLLSYGILNESMN